MGICSSSTSSIATAKLILQDGRLQEYSYPIKASYILRNYPSSFICNSDDMEFNDVVLAIKDDDTLQLGQLYFMLPLERLKRPLQAEEMAALAVRASSALSKSVGGGCDLKDVKVCSSRKVAADDGGGFRRKRGRKQNFPVMLSAIPE